MEVYAEQLLAFISATSKSALSYIKAAVAAEEEEEDEEENTIGRHVPGNIFCELLDTDNALIDMRLGECESHGLQE